jgi:hypothetical protein
VEGQRKNAHARYAAVIARSNRTDWLVCMSLEQFARLWIDAYQWRRRQAGSQNAWTAREESSKMTPNVPKRPGAKT